MRIGHKKKAVSVSCLISIALLLIPSLLFAQQYPTKPIDMIVGFSAGGATDLAMRTGSAAAEKFLGQSINIINKGGASGSIATGLVAKEKPDGYTVLGSSSSGFLYQPHLFDLPYSIDDFKFICTFGSAPGNGIVVKGDAPWKTLQELIDYTKKNPGKVTYGTSGTGGPTHLAMETIAKQEGLQWTHVPFQGSSKVLVALLGGHIMVQSGGVLEFEDQIKTGAIRVLATQEDNRMKMLPNVPTMKELGYDWVGVIAWIIAAPKGTPPAAVKKIEDAYRSASKDPDFIKTMNNMGHPIGFKNSQETTDFIKKFNASIGKIITELNLRKEK